MFYSIRHLTKFLYSKPVSESMMETRMHPRSDANQRCLTFHLSVSPRCRVFSYRDHLANHVHHFDIPGQHPQLVIVAESLVEVQPALEIPSFLAPEAWKDLDQITSQGDYYEFLAPASSAPPPHTSMLSQQDSISDAATTPLRCCTSSTTIFTDTSTMCLGPQGLTLRSTLPSNRVRVSAKTSPTS